MSDEQAFLAAIRAAPDDDAPRLVFADWLDERGDPRGPWLRDPLIGPWMGVECADPVPRLIAALPERPDIGAVLVRLGEPAVPALLQALRDPDPERRELFRVVLAQMTEHLWPFAATLIVELTSLDPLVRTAATEALALRGDLREAALAALIIGLGDPDTRDSAFERLAALGPAAAGAVPRILELWRAEAEARSGTGFRERAADTLGAIAPAGPQAIPVLAAALAHPVLQAPVANSLARFGAAAVGPLTAALDRLDVQGGMLVTYSLVPLLRNPPAHFAELLSDPATGARARRAVLAWFRTCAAAEVRATFPAVSAQLDHADPAVGLAAAEVFQQWGKDTSVAIPALDRAGRSAAADLRAAALGALVSVAPESTVTRNALRRGLADPDPAVRAAAAEGFAELKAVPLAVREARALVRDDDPAVRTVGVEALGLLLEHADEANSYDVDEDGLALDPADTAEDEELDEAIEDATRLLLRALEDRSRTVRGAAARVLGEHIPESASNALGPLQEALSDPAPAVRAGAARAIPRLDDYDDETVPALLKAAQDDEPEVVCAALTALGACRVDDPAAVRAIRTALRNPDSRVRAAAARGLESWETLPVMIGREVPGLLADPDPGVRLAAVGLVGGILADDADEQAFEAYRSALTDPDRGVREAALNALSDLGTEAVDRAAVDVARALAAEPDEELASSQESVLLDAPSRGAAVAGLLDSPTEAVRLRALRLLVGAGPAAAPAVPGLLAELARESQETWYLALEALAGIGPAAAAALPRLMGLINPRDPSPSTALAVRAIGTLGPAAAPALPQIEEVARAENGYGRYDAIQALATLSADFDHLTPFVREHLRGDDAGTANAAATGVRRLGARAGPYIPDLAARLETGDSDDRRALAEILGEIGPAAAPAVPALAAALRGEPDTWVRHQIVQALGAIGPPAASAVPVLARAADDEDGTVRLAAVQALGQTRSPAAVEALRTILFDRDLRSRQEAARALGQVGPAAVAAVSDLCRALMDPRWATGREGEIDRTLLLDALANLGPEARPAVPTLKRLLNDETEDVSRRAAEVLKAVGK